ncbi:hypothetical protein SLEP1_g23458 [Rubroshorea leprosula]|uniref:Uncharacterized protein n=1 Tax=Rubroshorea leprosula TaxID=152421 RepID=A0AAV5JJM8_9ROSI|nr:hypothetical protein SLEP1_g23458 [Rubroshorea leprosula]
MCYFWAYVSIAAGFSPCQVRFCSWKIVETKSRMGKNEGNDELEG